MSRDAGGLPLVHRMWRRLPRAPRRAALDWLTLALAPRIGPAPSHAAPGLAVAGELDRASGLGEGARLMLRTLELLDTPAYPLCIGDSGARVPPPGVPLVVHADAPGLAAALLRLPRHLVRGRLVIGYCAWELPVVPDRWRAGLAMVHAVWVPSAFSGAALRPLVGDRLRCVPHAVACGQVAPAALSRADFGFAEAVVVVLASFSLASSFERKNPVGTVAAFRAAFGDRADRLLVLKLVHGGHFPADLARLQGLVAGLSNVRLDTRDLPAADLLAMMRCADIVLSLHRAEGFGLVPAEAMRLGTPVIATGWSGNMQYMEAGSAALVGYRLVPADDPRGVFMAPGAVWAEPDQADAVAQLRRLAGDAAARASLGQAGAARVRAVLGTDGLRDALAAIGVGAAIG